jgi:signal transduction histidine kinase
MFEPGCPENEEERLQALASYNILDTIPEKDFDDITRIAAHICQTPIALVSLIDHDRQWFKSHHGLDAEETPRNLSFCAHAILDPDNVLVVPDSLMDDRFKDNPFANGPPDVRFYAGAPLMTPDGFPLGTLCVIDSQPRELSQEQIHALEALSSQVVAQLELRKNVRELQFSQKELESSVEDLKRFAYVTSHDLKTPLRGMASIVDWLLSDHADQLNDEGKNYLDLLQSRAVIMQNLIDGILEYSRTLNRDRTTYGPLDLAKTIDQAIMLTEAQGIAEFTTSGIEEAEITSSPMAVLQILQNLIGNAIQHREAETCNIDIAYEKNLDFHMISITDDGPGIAPRYHEKIFEMFQTLGPTKKEGDRGTGIGLASVKKLVEKMDGKVDLISDAGQGATFKVYLPL